MFLWSLACCIPRYFFLSLWIWKQRTYVKFCVNFKKSRVLSTEIWYCASRIHPMRVRPSIEYSTAKFEVSEGGTEYWILHDDIATRHQDLLLWVFREHAELYRFRIPTCPIRSIRQISHLRILTSPPKLTRSSKIAMLVPPSRYRENHTKRHPGRFPKGEERESWCIVDFKSRLFLDKFFILSFVCRKITVIFYVFNS